ncbi:MAG: hypothetical protein FE044_03475 [Thermoplasmata archaeon]|nr:MAG: hypothetical protein FE044_03475 [Thermoplasmata archaeon]
MEVRSLLAYGTAILLLFSFNVMGDGKSTVSITPQNKMVYLNDTFTISILVSPSQPIYSAGCDIYFNSSVLQVLSISKGSFELWFDYALVIDNTNGSITYIMAASNDSISEDTILATIEFKAISTGFSYINISNAFVGVTSPNIINGSITVVEDKTPPSTIIHFKPSLPNGEHGWYISNISINLTATDDLSGVNVTYYSLDGGNFVKYAGNFTVDEEGIHIIQFYSIDNRENSEDIKEAMIKIDKTPPLANITEYPPAITNIKNITFKWNGSDNLTPYENISFSYKLKGYDTIWNNWTKEKEITYFNLSEGNYTFMLRAKDEAGNIGSIASKNFSISTAPPVIKNVTAMPQLQKIGGFVNISCLVYGANVQNVSLSIKYPDGSIHDFTMLEYDNGYYYNRSYSMVGNYNFSISAIDSAGNIGKANGTFRIKDMTPPNVKISYPKAGEILRGKVEIRWNATDNHDARNKIKITIKYSSDDGATWQKIAEDLANDGNYTWNTTGLKDGKEYRLQMIARDTTGNEGRDVTSRFTIDNTLPSLEIKKPIENYLYIFDRPIIPVIGGNALIIGKITIQVDANDSTSGMQKVEFYIGNELKSVDKSSPYEWLWQEMAIGRHEIKIKAYDKAGNVATKSVNALVLIL